MRGCRRSALWGVLALVRLLGVAVQGFAYDDNAYTRETLRGLSGVGVVIEDLSSNATRAGLTTAQLQTDVELRLRKAGVRVLTASERKETPGGPFLAVIVTAREKLGLYGYSVEVHFLQRVYLERNFTDALAITWAVDSTGTVGADRFRQGIRESVGDHIDKFLNAYLAVNPRTPPAQPTPARDGQAGSFSQPPKIPSLSPSSRTG